MEKKPDIQQFKGQYRLPKFAIPKRYDLVLKPDLSACTFSGSVQVDLSISQVTHFLVLNALDLQIHQASFTNSQNKKYCPCDVVLEADDEVLVLVLMRLSPLEMGFCGFHFLGTYVDGGVKKNMAATQFEPADARMCFPCWDEPALKASSLLPSQQATFKVTVEVPSELTALSNMPAIQETVNGHLKTVYFEESSTMSTYLVAVVVGLFDHIEDTTADGIKVRAYCPVGKADQGKFALDVAVKTLDMFTGCCLGSPFPGSYLVHGSRYFSMPYPLPKMDMVAVPDFSGGAMENYGLIIFREIELLYDEMHSGAYRKQRATYNFVSHEVAHQWFGNLVTMEWWTHLWLNEGFATWISNLATDWLFPEWKIWTQFVQETTGGLRLDALEQSHPN
ncbi:Aminopeptidase M1 [Vitis vinifera]|uniref:Aminopeptidase M1 n=1 Tax=Vitis vinifera TaxID=29760 RepID=A0A438K6V1_VITVI|nr:Aminopeptidase M1 [Vitis vinifera]